MARIVSQRQLATLSAKTQVYLDCQCLFVLRAMLGREGSSRAPPAPPDTAFQRSFLNYDKCQNVSGLLGFSRIFHSPRFARNRLEPASKLWVKLCLSVNRFDCLTCSADCYQSEEESGSSMMLFDGMPGGQHEPGMGQRGEQGLVEAFVPGGGR